MRLPAADAWASTNPLLRDAVDGLPGPVRLQHDHVISYDDHGDRHRRDIDVRDLVRSWEGDPATWITAGLREVGRGRSTIVEHTSVNPVHPLHVAALRGSLVGNGLVHLLRHAGVPVSARYFVNDLGRQVHFAGWGMQHVDLASVPDHVRFDHIVGIVYALANMLHASRTADIERLCREHPWLPHALKELPSDVEADITAALERADSEVYRSHLGRMVRLAAGDLAAVGARIDTWELESGARGAPTSELSLLVEHSRLVTVNGVMCVASSAGLIPVVRPDGRDTYFLRDLRNVLLRPGDAHMIHVVGAEQRLLQTELQRVAATVGRTVEHVAIGDVVLGPKRSSARQARLVTVEEVRSRCGNEGLADLCLAMVCVDRSRRLRLDVDRRSPWTPTVRAARHAITRSARQPGDHRGDGELEALCVRAPGVLAGALEQRQIAPVARLLILLSQQILRTTGSGEGIHAVTLRAIHEIYAIAARACGQTPLERTHA